MSTINTNLNAAFNAIRLDHSQTLLSRTLNRLSSGSKISSPGDDPTGVSSSSRMDAENLRLQAAMTNIQNGVSYTQTSDSLMGAMSKTITRMSELISLAQDPTKSAADTANYKQEFVSLQDQLRSTIGGTTGQIGGITGVANPTGSFNGVQLFGPNSTGVPISIGADAGQTLVIGENNLRTGGMLSLIQQDNAGNYTLSISAPTAQSAINGGLDQLGTARADIGAFQSRLDLVSNRLQVEQENLKSALSQIQDVDVASESTQLAKYNILVQSSTAMLAQANQEPQSVLKLLEG